MKTKLSIYALAALTLINETQAQSRADNAVPVNPDNFIRAETDHYFSTMVKNGSFGKFTHNRAFGPIEKQNAIVRPQRDTLFSLGVFDLDAGPVTVILPNAGKHFMSMQVMDEDMYTPQVIYDAGSYTFTREQIDTRYVVLVVRILVDTANPDDVKWVPNLQDAIKVSQQSPGSFEVPNWDPASQKKVRDSLKVLGATVPDTKRMFGTKDQVDPVRRLIGAASFWGAILRRTDCISTSHRPRTMARPSTSLTSRMCRSTASGRSPSTTPRDTSSPTSLASIPLTTSPRRKARTVQSPSSSAAATVPFLIVCRS